MHPKFEYLSINKYTFISENSILSLPVILRAFENKIVLSKNIEFKFSIAFKNKLESFLEMSQAMILAKYPIALASDANHINANVYEKTKTGYKITDLKCKVLLSISQSDSFIGVCPYQDNDEVVQILRRKPNSITLNDSFYCLKCCTELQGHSENIKRHLETKKHKCHIEKLLPTEVNQLTIAWFTSHQISFNAMADSLIHILIPSLSSLPVFKELIAQSAAIIQVEIKKKLSEAEFVSIASDGWRTKESRKLGIAFHATDNTGETRTFFAALRDPPQNTLGSNEISQIISDVIGEYEIETEKLIAFVSDSASDMAATANNLNLPWDRCFCHILSNIIEESLLLLPERFDKIHNNIVSLKKAARWVEYFNHIYKVEHPEFKNYTNITTSVPTRWGTRLQEVLSILKFQDPIESFYQHEGVLMRKTSHILKSDFEMLADLKEIFTFIIDNLEGLQKKEINSNIAVVAFKIIQIADSSREFYLQKEREQQEEQKKADEDFESGKTSIRRIVPLSHLAEPILNIYSKIKEVFIDSEEEFCMRMKAAMLFDPSIPLELPSYCSDLIDRTINWVSSKIEDENDSNNQSRSTTSSQIGTPFYQVQLGSQSNIPQSIVTIERWLEMRSNFMNIQNPHLIWKSQIHSNLKKFVLNIFSHRVSNSPVESFFSICSGFVDDNKKYMDPQVLECLAIIACNRELYLEKIVKPIRDKYKI